MQKALIVAALISATPAQAAWMYEGEESAFGGSGTHVALTSNGPYALGVRCDEFGASLIFLTPEVLDPSDTEMFLRLLPKLLIRIDDQPPIERPAMIDSAQRMLRLTAPAEKVEVEALRDAQSKVSAAVNLGGQVLHEARFSARGSTSALTKFLAGCQEVE